MEGQVGKQMIALVNLRRAMNGLVVAEKHGQMALEELKKDSASGCLDAVESVRRAQDLMRGVEGIVYGRVREATRRGK